MKIILEILNLLVALLKKNKAFEKLAVQGLSATWNYPDKVVTCHISFFELSSLDASVVKLIADTLNKHQKVTNTEITGNVITVTIIL